MTCGQEHLRIPPFSRYIGSFTLPRSLFVARVHCTGLCMPRCALPLIYINRHTTSLPSPPAIFHQWCFLLHSWNPQFPSQMGTGGFLRLHRCVVLHTHYTPHHTTAHIWTMGRGQADPLLVGYHERGAYALPPVHTAHRARALRLHIFLAPRSCTHSTARYRTAMTHTSRRTSTPRRGTNAAAALSRTPAALPARRTRTHTSFLHTHTHIHLLPPRLNKLYGAVPRPDGAGDQARACQRRIRQTWRRNTCARIARLAARGGAQHGGMPRSRVRAALPL